MKYLFSLLVFTLVSYSANAQSLSVSPDSGRTSTYLPVAISGSGTHFHPSHNVSGFDYVTVSLNQMGGPVLYAVHPTNISSDTALTTTFYLPDSLAPGWYDVTVARGDSVPYHYITASAFRVTVSPSIIIAINPSSAYANQSLPVQITGQATDFQANLTTSEYNTVSVTLSNANATMNVGSPDSIWSATQLRARLTIPVGALPGTYDVQVRHNHPNGYYYQGAGLFTILPGTPPSISVTPDSGQASTILPVTITGQGFRFTPTNNVSELNMSYIELSQNGHVYYTTNPTSIRDTATMIAWIVLTDSLAPGKYNLHLHAYTSPTSVDVSTPFYVLPKVLFSFKTPRVAAQGEAVGLTFSVNGGQFIRTVNGQRHYAYYAWLDGFGSPIQTDHVTVLDSSTVTAFFHLPEFAPVGVYSMYVVEPDSTRILFSNNAFNLASGAAIMRTASDTIAQGTSKVVTFKTKSILSNEPIISIQATRLATTLTGTVQSRPPSIDVLFTIPPGAPLGDYSVVMNYGQGESVTVLSGLIVTASSGVSDKPAGDASEIERFGVMPDNSNGNTRVSFALRQSVETSVAIYDLLGREVASLFRGHLDGGPHEVNWNSISAAPGTYFVRLNAGGTLQTGKIIVTH